MAPGTAGGDVQSGFFQISFEGTFSNGSYGQTFLGSAVETPEIDAASGLLAIGAVLAALLLVFERKRRRHGG